MKRIASLKAILFFSLLLGCCSISAQDYVSTKEKIYIQTDHVFYKPGDVLYFKLYLVKAQDQTASQLSSVVYAELISPAGTVVKKSPLKVTDGYAEGSFDFTDQSVGGVYKIRAYTSWMLNEKESQVFIKEITLQKVIAPRVLMKLDFPEKGYSAGSLVKANFSMRNIADEPIRNYNVKYAVSIGGEIVSTQNFKTGNDGKAVINFTLPNDLATTDGLLNVTVDYNAYTEAISRSIPIVLNKIDLQFMPEGGTFINGMPNTVAFKALNENGKAADIKGYIIDSRGNKAGSFESYHFGMGKFLFAPQAGQSYKAVITSPAGISQQFSLPAAVNDGIAMHISKENKKITVQLTSNTAERIHLKATVKSITYYHESIGLKKGSNTITIDEGIFPAGIAQFTLYRDDELPLAERLVFLNEQKLLYVTITTDKQRYLPREKVMLTVKTMDEKGDPIASNLSLAVVDDKLWTFADDKQDHILSWLLLSSELKGKIEEPQFYFKKDEPKAVPALDLLMLTHGYRYFDYTEYVLNQKQLKFMPDQANILSGQIVGVDKKPVRAKLFLMNAKAFGKAIKIDTDDDGMFFFSDLQPQNNYFIYAQAFNKKQKIDINIMQNGMGYNPTKANQLRQLISISKDFDVQAKAIAVAEKKEAKEQEQLFNLVQGPRAELKEVVVTGAFGVKRAYRSMTSSVSIISMDELKDVKDWGNALAGRVAGIQVTSNANPADGLKISIRGMGSSFISGPLFVVNGIPMEQLQVNSISANDIDDVTVLKDAAATSLYGSRAANGLVVITLKKTYYDKLGFNFTPKYFYTSKPVYTGNMVYAVARKFYAPVYVTTDVAERSDFRETIYWNPTIQTGKDGTASVSFYNSDASTTFRAVAEGIAYNGKVGRTETTYSVQNALQVDAKIPPYLTVGDKALLPLVIKNNSGESKQFTVSVLFPGNFKNGTYSNSVTVSADSSLRLLVPAEATAALKGTIQFIVSGPNEKEAITLPVSAVEKGFPVVETFSGNKNAQHQFTINKMIPGSLKSNLRLFKNLEGQLMDGIESMLREPYGCFEQTSSSTYPNIYVLKYLRESGKSNPAIEQKALDYIERGYKRLIGFETAQNGFEWFGHTPPHEALTAYGLMEFTDMQGLVDVDKQMLERTKKFLLGRRDGDGTFSVINRGYDQFASVPAKIANTYIVYALTQAGVGKEIEKEYTTAVKKAIESKDGYQLAMMAIAASNMKDMASFKTLMEQLDQQYQKVNFNAETSVVNSRDASLRVETCSLYAMALMKGDAPPLGKIADLISRILKEKSYYGYGSTQSTVLALKALVEYTKLMGKVTEDGPINFTLNNKVVDADKAVIANLQEGSNSFTVNYVQKGNAIPYNLEVAYNTFTPPNSDKAELKLNTVLKNTETKLGETVRMDIAVTNIKNNLQPMAIAKIGIPAGLSVQPWQLKEIMEKNQVAYYEIFDNYLVFYWMGFASGETKNIFLDLKADVPGTYKGKASNTYLYYTPEYKNWNDGVEITITE
ncbi:TonB-dependent receptor plug domain-containing protein [Ferruginibacter sp.]